MEDYFDHVNEPPYPCKWCDKELKHVVRPVFDYHILHEDLKQKYGVEEVFQNSILMLKFDLGKYEYCIDSFEDQNYIIEMYFKILDKLLVE